MMMLMIISCSNSCKNIFCKIICSTVQNKNNLWRFTAKVPICKVPTHRNVHTVMLNSSVKAAKASKL